ncbi:MAG: cytochrome c [Acidobacteria bacterium]|nr:cytochrome c [Acidobacteriota bacterium]
MRRAMLFLLLCVTGAAPSAVAQTAPSDKNGKAVFDKWCAPCHGAVAPARGMFGGGALPGTAALAVKYKGRVPAVLEERSNLAPGFIRTVVRNGVFGMPITRKTEISDAELEDLVAYLTRKSARGG